MVLLLNPPGILNYSRASRSPAVTKSGTLYYPIFLCYAGAFLKKNNINFDIIDCVADSISEKKIISIINKKKYKYIIVDTSIPSGKKDIKFANKLKKKFNEIKIILVGPYPTSYLDEINELSDNQLDYIICKEYENSLLEILNDNIVSNNIYLNKNNLFVKAGFQNPVPVDLNELPFISSIYKEKLNIKKYFYSAGLYPVVSIMNGRGCPYKCKFCNLPQSFYLTSYRRRNVEKAIAEFDYINKNLPFVKEIWIEDDSFNIDLNYINEFCDGLIKIKNKIKWTVNFVPRNFNYLLLKKMKIAKCRLLIVGFESIESKNKKYISEKNDLKKYVKLSQLALKLNIKIHGCFVFGFPEDNRKTIIKTINFAHKLKLDTAQFFPLMLNKNTELYNFYDKNNYLKNYNSDFLTKQYLHFSNIKTKYLTAEQINYYCYIARKKYYLNSKYIFHKLKKIFFDKNELFRTIKSFITFFKYLV